MSVYQNYEELCGTDTLWMPKPPGLSLKLSEKRDGRECISLYVHEEDIPAALRARFVQVKLADVLDMTVSRPNCKDFLLHLDECRVHHLESVTIAQQLRTERIAQKMLDFRENREREAAMLFQAHADSFHGAESVKRGGKCGCYYCCRIFDAEEITEWWDNGRTAVCPYCGIDSVINENDGAPITSAFLRQMKRTFFS